MHAVIVRVTSDDFEGARDEVESRVIPRVKQAPGFVAGYWFAPVGNQAWSLLVFDSEEAARTAAERLQPPQNVTVEHVDVREVVAHA
jgi:hypothetical protein